ncbi:HAD hydrolase-like protein [Candidatus Pacearchaeota archaeon]|nr:HAD hydrolase-like protein [Candidatus Pacearchaeota archaeon]
MIKLIIFDLDDCLVDTWGAMIPTLIKQALKEMIKAGLQVKSFRGAIKKLENINRYSKNGSEAIKKFLQSEEADLKFLERGEKGFYDFNFEYKINPLPGVIEMLKRTDAEFAIVTKGELKAQIKKLRKAGIAPSIFKEIVAVSDYNKKNVYGELIKKRGYAPEECLVCGDRYETDLLPAKELGIKTIYVSWGRGKNFPPEIKKVDFIVSDLKEIIKIVN